MENNEIPEVDATIVAIKEEYETKLKEQEKQLREEFAAKEKETEEKHVKQLRALLAGRQEVKEVEEKTMTFEEELTAKMLAKYNIKR